VRRVFDRFASRRRTGGTGARRLPAAADTLRLLEERIAAGPRRRPPASGEQLRAAEASLDFRLPAFLGCVYTTIANGSFGPGRGLAGLPDGPADERGSSIVDLYDTFSASSLEDPAWRWPERLVPLCPWDDFVYSCVDCWSAEGTVVCLDLSEYRSCRDLGACLAPQRPMTVEGWLRAWAEGVDLWEEMFPLDLA
jgi:hypothetical protein